MWGFFALGLVGVGSTIAALLRRYAAPSVPLVVSGATAYAWLVSMSIVLITPMDVAAALAHAPEAAIGVLWKITYWSTQVLTWLALPFFQVYADAGDFTVGGRALTSLKENGLLYGLAAAAGVVGLLVIVVVERSLAASDLPALGMALSNTFGLCAGILLMGYGLVEIPRETWKADPAHQLKWCAHRAGRFAEEVLRTTAELESVVTVIVANDKQMPRRDPLRPYMAIISAAAESESPVKPSAVLAGGYDLDALHADDLEYNYDMAGLAALRRRLAAAIHEFQAAAAQYEAVVRQALEHEAVVKCRQLGVYEPPGLPPGATGLAAAVRRAAWRWRCVAQPGARKVVAALLAAMSGVVVWSEATIFTGGHPDLSPFSRAIRGAAGRQWGAQLLVALPLGYICWCTAFALFRLNAFNYNKLAPRATTGAALMQNGSLMARFAAPTCWNLLHMVHMDAAVDASGAKTVFTQNMGGMTVLPVLGQHLNTYLPALLVLHVSLVWFNLWDRLAGACVGSRFRFNNDDVDDQYTEKGRLLLRKEGEALANGLRIGEVLAADDLELQLPGFKQRKRLRKKTSWFSFGRPAAGSGGGAAAGGDAGGAGAAGGAGSSAAAAAAGGAAGSRLERLPMLGSMLAGRSDGDAAGEGRAGLLSSLMGNKHGASPASSDGEGARSGLDGIFAEISTPAPGGGRGRGGGGGGGAGTARRGSRG
ncbi:lmbrd2 [Scenedesmus sp. PABB004]|nr:lmbrd2 [Scenedesmus sp. PABB004]